MTNIEIFLIFSLVHFRLLVSVCFTEHAKGVPVASSQILSPFEEK